MMHSEYRIDTGVGTGNACSNPDDNPSEGCAWWPEFFDHRELRVDVSADPPALVQFAPPPQEPGSTAWLHAEIQAKATRNGLLAACDGVAWRYLDAGEPLPDPWRTYRQALRDLPTAPGWPLTHEIPTAPNAT